MAELNNKKKFYYIDAVTVSVAKRICQFYFEDIFDRIEKNDEKRTYDIFLIEPQDSHDKDELNDDIQYFIDYWGASYKFYYSANK